MRLSQSTFVYFHHPLKEAVIRIGEAGCQRVEIWGAGQMELATAMEHKCSLTWVVLNNHALGWPQYIQVLTGEPTIETSWSVWPDLVKLAEAQAC